MAEPNDKIVADYLETLEQLRQRTAQLDNVVTRTVQALAKHGVQLSVDLGGMVSDVVQVVGALDQRGRRVLQHMQRQRELVRTMTLITSSLDLDQVLAEIMDTIITMTSAERAYLMLREKDDGELTIRAARNWDRQTISDDEASFSRSVVNMAIEQLEPVITTNAQGDERFQGLKSVVQHGLRSILCIPLTLHGRVVGVLYADNRIEQGVFSTDEIPLLTAFATQAAIAIENAKIFERVQEDLRETQRELQHLKIQIDRAKVRQQVSEITESEYFARLSEAAKAIRAKRQARQRKKGG